MVVHDFAALLKFYRLIRVTGDRYAGEFPRELFRKHGIADDLTKQTKSELFRDPLPLLNSGRIVLPRNFRCWAKWSAERWLLRQGCRAGKCSTS